MAVAHDAVSSVAAGTTTRSWTHTPSGTPKGVLVFVVTIGNISNKISSVTYGSKTLTFLDGALDSAGEPGRVDCYFAGTGIPTGAQTVTVNRSSGSENQWAVAVTVTAATTATDAKNLVKYAGDRAGLEAAVDDASPGANSVRYAAAYCGVASVNATTGGSTTLAPGSNSTNLANIDFGAYVAQVVRETTAGQGSRSVGFYATGSDDWASIHLAIRESIGGTLAVTEGADTLSGSGSVYTASYGTLAVSEAADTLTSNVDAIAKGTLSSTEGADTLASTVDAIAKGTLSSTEAADTMSGAAKAIVTGKLGKVLVQSSAFQSDTFQIADDTEAGDTLAGAGKAIVTGSLAVSEAADTLSGIGDVDVAAVFDVTEAADTLTSSGTVGFGAIPGTLDATEGPDVLSGTVKAIASATLALTEWSDTLAANAKAIVTGKLGKVLVQSSAFQSDTFQLADDTEAADSLTASGAVTVTGTLGVTEGGDTLSAAAELGASLLAFQSDAFDAGGFQTTQNTYAFTDAFQSDAFEALGGTTVTQPTDAVLTGGVSLEGTFSRIIDVSANLSGSGSITAPATINQPAFSGAFQLDAFQATTDRPYEYDRASEGLSGFVRLQGLFDVGGVEKAVSATLSGRGSLTVLPDMESLPPMRLEGTGYITATASIIHARGSYLSGKGNLTASAGRVFDVGEVTLSGAGSLVGTVGNMLETEAELSGTGSLSVAETERVRNVGAVLLRGSGMVAAAAINGAIHMAANLSGTGSLTADLDQTHARSSNLAGHGSLTASAGVIREVSVRLAGSGSMSVVARKTNKKTYPAVLLIAT